MLTTLTRRAAIAAPLPSLSRRVRRFVVRGAVLGVVAAAGSGRLHAQPVARPADAAPQGRILAPGAVVERLFAGGTFTEGVAVAPDEAVYFCDAPPSARGGSLGHIWRYDPRTGQTAIYRSPSGQANGMKFDGEGRMVVVQGADYGGRAVVRTDLATGKSTLVAGGYRGRPFNSLNDLAVDRRGRLYVTDPRYVGHEAVEQPVFGVYRIDPGSDSVHLVIADVKPNGVAVAPDGRTLYVAEHFIGTTNIPAMPAGARPVYGPMRVLAFDLSPAGGVTPAALAGRRAIADFGAEDGPDGMVTDAAGNVYVAARAAPRFGVRVYSPQGTELAYIPTPEVPTNVAFGRGAERRTLYITAGASLYRVRTVAEGWHPGAPR